MVHPCADQTSRRTFGFSIDTTVRCFRNFLKIAYHRNYL